MKTAVTCPQGDAYGQNHSLRHPYTLNSKGGELSDDHVRFALIENKHRTRQAIRGIRDMLRNDGATTTAAIGSGE